MKVIGNWLGKSKQLAEMRGNRLHFAFQSNSIQVSTSPRRALVAIIIDRPIVISTSVTPVSYVGWQPALVTRRLHASSGAEGNFGVRSQPDIAGVFVPNKFLVLLSAIVAALPWIHWRFSLRTLLIATTLVAVALGLIIAVAR